MRKIVLRMVGLSLVLVGAASAQITIYSDGGDGMLENRFGWTEPVVHNTDDWGVSIGEWWGDGLTTFVMPFQLPDYGAIPNPFDTAGFGVNYYNKGDSTVTDIDLYAVRTSTNSSILATDWYNGEDDTNATMIQVSFLTPTNVFGPVSTSETGDANLVAYLNEAYDGGAGARHFVFLRLSYQSSNFATGWDAYNVTTRNAALVSDWPVITATATTADTDMDGLPDIWEGANGLDPYDDGTIDENNGPIGDPDFDGLVNSNEYARGTGPQIFDTDNDGLSDGSEVHTNLTEVLVWDTDDDGLSDGDEVNNTLTDPLLADTDEDEEDDWFEIWQGTDPLDPESSSAALGLLIVDGTLDAGYGDAVATQTVNTAWEDNLDELDAAYAYVQNDRLFLMITGNMNTNWSKYNIFIDSTDAVTTNLFEAAGNNTATNMNGLVFDEGFSPDYHMSLRLGEWAGDYELNLDWEDLSTKAISWHQNLLEGSLDGTGYMGPGDANSNAMAIAYDSSNTNGLVFGTGAASVPDVLAVTSGLELSIALSDIGNPYGEIRVAVMVAGEPYDPVSNQILGGLTPVQDALGAASTVDFNAYAGEQFFSFVGKPLPQPAITAVQLISGNTEVQFDVDGLIAGYDYMMQDSASLILGFSDVAGSEFTAASTNETITMPVDAGASAMFFRVSVP